MEENKKEEERGGNRVVRRHVKRLIKLLINERKSLLIL